MTIYPACYNVVGIPFLKRGCFTRDVADEARAWCKKNCADKFISSDLRPWAFLSEKDAAAFAERFGGTVKFKPEERGGVDAS
jgi:hypothetical protein